MRELYSEIEIGAGRGEEFPADASIGGLELDVKLRARNIVDADDEQLKKETYGTDNNLQRSKL